jgi:hypothetical protein
VFSKNGDRLLDHEVVEAFFTEVMMTAKTGSPKVSKVSISTYRVVTDSHIPVSA